MKCILSGLVLQHLAVRGLPAAFLPEGRDLLCAQKAKMRTEVLTLGDRSDTL